MLRGEGVPAARRRGCPRALPRRSMRRHGCDGAAVTRFAARHTHPRRRRSDEIVPQVLLAARTRRGRRASGRRAEDRAPRLHGARDRPDQGVRGRRSTRRTRTSSSSGCATRPASSPRSSSPRRPIRRPTSSSARRRRAWRSSPTKGMLQPYAPKGLDKISPQYRDPKNPPEWVGMDVYGAAICFNTVEAAKHEPAEARDVEGPDQAGLQGQDRDAESGVVGHRLPRRGRRGCRCGARRTRWKYMDALHENIAQYTHSGSQAVPPGGRRRIPDRHLVRVSRGDDQEVGRADRHHLPDGRPGLGPRSVGHHEEHEEGRGRARS